MKFRTLVQCFCCFQFSLLSLLVCNSASAETSWDAVYKTGIVRIGVIPNRPPYSWQKNERWTGISVTMGSDLAVALSNQMKKPIKPEFVITSWTTVVMDIQADKVDAFFGLNSSEPRKRAINLAGPLYSVPSVVLNARGFQPGSTWNAYDKEDTKVSVVMGTTDEAAARQNLPHARIRALKGTSEAVLDLQSGNANAFVTTALAGMSALKSNPTIGKLTVLTPVSVVPSYAGTRRDGDPRFVDFLQKWATDYNASGRSRAAILGAAQSFGLDTTAFGSNIKF